MLLSCRILDNVGGVNTFDVTTQAEFTQGVACTVYLQLIDASKDRMNVPAGRRYVPEDGATLQVVVDSIDDAKKITRSASQPYDGDGSIWCFPVLSTDPIKGTATLRLRLTQGEDIVYGTALKAISISPQDAN